MIAIISKSHNIKVFVTTYQTISSCVALVKRVSEYYKLFCMYYHGVISVNKI